MAAVRGACRRPLAATGTGRMNWYFEKTIS
jgi:hypothetical protein